MPGAQAAPTAKQNAALVTSPPSAMTCQATVDTPGFTVARTGAVSCLPPSPRATDPSGTAALTGAVLCRVFPPKGRTGSCRGFVAHTDVLRGLHSLPV
ncbi:hypothetical protein GCM10018793_70830 [Streptomyces sulfonofaciens]|uniref:Uncharacterized protein n=1 Tax=Streptomyces sulfonofaciens TaxID=68272 RepID=A0A919GQE0_9ACTN|nr:hypothetical protein GCM10018793_70830 [Streptomyces sulfonofaciens]